MIDVTPLHMKPRRHNQDRTRLSSTIGRELRELELIHGDILESSFWTSQSVYTLRSLYLLRTCHTMQCYMKTRNSDRLARRVRTSVSVCLGGEICEEGS